MQSDPTAMSDAELVAEAQRREQEARRNIEHAEADADGWHSAMPVSLMDTWKADAAFYSALAQRLARQAPTDTDVGKLWSKCRSMLSDFGERYQHATRYEEASAIADDFSRKITDLFLPARQAPTGEVPREPTPAMCAAGDKLRYSGASNYDSAAIYRAMLSSAPASPTGSEVSALLARGWGPPDSEYALYQEAVALVLKERNASTSYLQRKLQLNYNTAARLMERMEHDGLVTSAYAGKREVLAPNTPSGV